MIAAGRLYVNILLGNIVISYRLWYYYDAAVPNLATERGVHNEICHIFSAFRRSRYCRQLYLQMARRKAKKRQLA